MFQKCHFNNEQSFKIAGVPLVTSFRKNNRRHTPEECLAFVIYIVF